MCDQGGASDENATDVDDRCVKTWRVSLRIVELLLAFTLAARDPAGVLQTNVDSRAGESQSEVLAASYHEDIPCLSYNRASYRLVDAQAPPQSLKASTCPVIPSYPTRNSESLCLVLRHGRT